MWRRIALATAAMLATASAAPPPGDTLPAGAPPSTAAGSPAAGDVVSLGLDAAARMTVPVTVAGAGPFPFVIDTGAERTVISRELAGQLALDSGGAVSLHSMSGVESVDTVMIPRLKVSADTIDDIRAPTLARRNIGASGILGIDSLHKQQVLLDFKAGTMTVRPSVKEREPEDPKVIVVKARSRFGQLIVTDARANGHKIAVIVDTGSEVSVGNMALRKKILGRPGEAPVFNTVIISVTGDTVPAEYTTIKNVQIGGLRLEGMHVAFADVHPFRKFQLLEKPALLLGMDTLRAFDRVSVDFANRRVRFIIPGGAGLDREQQVAALDSFGD